jgi:oxygen tolerance protein BatD
VVCALQGSAQTISFTASVENNRVGVGDQFEITFSLGGTSAGSNFQPPPFTDFLVIGGPNQSTSMQFINGSVSSSVSWSFVLQPKAEGKFTIGPATIDYGGKKLQTQPIAMEVAKGSAQPAQQQGRQQAQQPGTADIDKQIGDNLILRVTLDKSRVYQGEQITATYKIYTRVNISNYNLTKGSSLTGFWSEDLDVPKQVQLSTETLNGKQYRVGILRRVALFPQRSGTLQIDPMEVVCAVQVQNRRRSNDIFDQFFNDPFFGNAQTVNHKVRSEPVSINVLPLPSANVPNGFNGAVGKYTVETWLDKRQTKTNEPVTLKVKISGRGNLKLLEPPAVTVPPDIERYDPKISDNIAHQGDEIAGSRTFEYLLLPRRAGELKIPSFSYAYFDIDKKAYVPFTSPEFPLSVEKGSDLAGGPATGISKEDVKLLGEDIRFMKSEDLSLRRKGESFAGSPLFFALSFSSLFSFIGFMFFVKRRERVLGDVAGLRNRKARKMAQKRLQEAKKFLHQKKEEQFYAEVSRALWGYIGDKLGIPPSDLSLQIVKTALESRGVSAEAVGKLSSAIERCEYARFAPSSGAVQMDAVYREAIEIISETEDQLR